MKFPNNISEKQLFKYKNTIKNILFSLGITFCLVNIETNIHVYRKRIEKLTNMKTSLTLS